MYRLLVSFMKEHFGDDARGRQKAWYFLPWHFDFFNRCGCGLVEGGRGGARIRGRAHSQGMSPLTRGRGA